jgi:FAD/FMN-containing dehydrogenase
VANYGLGVDQILGAKVVNSEGRIIEADEKMLQVIRGGGGALGVIVAMTIKTYPLDKVDTRHGPGICDFPLKLVTF